MFVLKRVRFLMVSEHFDLKNMINKEIEVKGIAHNSKVGACIKTNQGNIVYLKDMFDWQEDLLAKEVTVSGLLIYEKYIPDPKISSNGAISQGAEGKQYVLINYTINTNK